MPSMSKVENSISIVSGVTHEGDGGEGGQHVDEVGVEDLGELLHAARAVQRSLAGDLLDVHLRVAGALQPLRPSEHPDFSED